MSFNICYKPCYITDVITVVKFATSPNMNWQAVAAVGCQFEPYSVQGSDAMLWALVWTKLGQTPGGNWKHHMQLDMDGISCVICSPAEVASIYLFPKQIFL